MLVQKIGTALLSDPYHGRGYRRAGRADLDRAASIRFEISIRAAKNLRFDYARLWMLQHAGRRMALQLGELSASPGAALFTKRHNNI